MPRLGPYLRVASAGLTLACLGVPLPLSALIVEEGRIVPEWRETRRPLPKAGASAETSFYPAPKGTVLGLTLLVDFPDQPPAFDSAAVSAWLNQEGFARSGCNGSVRDYFRDVSNGQVDLRNEVHGFYRARHPKSHYDEGPGYGRAGELLEEILTHFDPKVDFSRFDNDKDGRTDAISIVYAGTGATWGQGIWPHAGTVDRRMDGVTVGRYMMTDLGEAFGLYVFCHEIGHMLFGWPDLYWFGDYCLMANRMDDRNPVAVNDFYRADQGWIPAQTLRAGTSARLSVRAGEAGFRFPNPADPGELFFWSNVRNTGRGAKLAGSGLLLLRFDRSRGGNTSATSRSLAVVEADGRNDLAGAQWPSPGSSATDFLHAGGRREVSGSTSPSTRWKSGAASGLRIHDIGPIGGEMAFSVGEGVPTALAPRAAAQAPEPGHGGHFRYQTSVTGWDARGALRRGHPPHGMLTFRP